MHGRRGWITAGIGLAAGLALVPATANAAGLIAAYDYYVPGKGFEIGLKDAQTGANLSLPAGVNTNDDEFHPALSRDGRYILFDRMRSPRPQRGLRAARGSQIQRVDRQTGAVTRFLSGPKIAGPAFVRGTHPTNGSITNTVSYGNQIAYFDGERSYVSQHMPIDSANNRIGPRFFNVSPVDTMNGTPSSRPPTQSSTEARTRPSGATACCSRWPTSTGRRGHSSRAWRTSASIFARPAAPSRR